MPFAAMSVGSGVLISSLRAISLSSLTMDVIPSLPNTVRRGEHGIEAWYLPELAAPGRR